MFQLLDKAISLLLNFILAFVLLFIAIVVGYPFIVISSVALTIYYTVAVVKITYTNFIKGNK